MTNTIEIKHNRSLVYWVIFSFIAWPLTFCVVWFAVFVYTILAHLIWVTGASMGPWFDLALAFISASTLGAMVGISVAILQRMLLRRYLLWTSEHWVLSSSLGGALGGIAILLLFTSFDSDIQGNNVFVVYALMPIFTGLLSLTQCLSLRQATRKPLMWLLANVVGGMAFSNILFMQPPYLDNAYFFINGQFLLNWIMAITAQGLITGIVIIYLFERQSYAPEPLYPEEDTTKSVWDRAI